MIGALNDDNDDDEKEEREEDWVENSENDGEEELKEENANAIGWPFFTIYSEQHELPSS